MIHPGTRILAFALFVAAVVRAGPIGLAIGAALACAAALVVQAPLATLWRLLRRSRWLFLSIAVIYLWLTPGQPLLDALGGVSPTVQGAAAGAHRVATLIVIVVAVNALLASASIESLVAGLVALSAPLRHAGLAPERIAVRLGLTLRYAVESPPSVAQQQPGAPSSYRERLGSRVAAAWRRALERADEGEPAALELPAAPRPGLADAALLAVPLMLWLV